MVGVLVSSGGFRGIELRSDETQNYAIYIFCFFASHTSLSTSIKCISSLARKTSTPTITAQKVLKQDKQLSSMEHIKEKKEKTHNNK
jgi:hypothetical protein